MDFIEGSEAAMTFQEQLEEQGAQYSRDQKVETWMSNVLCWFQLSAFYCNVKGFLRRAPSISTDTTLGPNSIQTVSTLSCLYAQAQ